MDTWRDVAREGCNAKAGVRGPPTHSRVHRPGGAPISALRIPPDPFSNTRQIPTPEMSHTEAPAHPYDLALWAIENNDAGTLKLVIKSNPQSIDDTHWCTAAEEGHTDMLDVLWGAMIPMDMQELRDFCQYNGHHKAMRWIDNLYN